MIINTRHPSYNSLLLAKYRLVYSGGRPFIERALKKYSNREDPQMFRLRRDLAFNPAYAEEAVNEYVAAINQRAGDIEYLGGLPLFQELLRGEKMGIDGQGNSLNNFAARQIVPELLPMGSVGVFVDNKIIPPSATYSDTQNIAPYIYIYRAEDILNWVTDSDGSLVAVFLAEQKIIYDEYGFPSSFEPQYRSIKKMFDGTIEVIVYNKEGNPTLPTTLEIEEFPFVRFSLPFSLLKNICDHQSALTNLASSNFFYAWASNFPFYVEQFDPYNDFFNNRRPNDNPTDPELTEVPTNEFEDTPETKRDENKITIGTLMGRRYPRELNPPSFISPPTEPLLAGLKLEDHLITEIRNLVAQNIANLNPYTRDAVNNSQTRLEGGLSFIGQELQRGMNAISKVFHSYFGEKNYTRVIYPVIYNLKSDADRREESKELLELQHAVPSRTFQREVGKKIALTMFEKEIDPLRLRTILEEIENSLVPTADPEILRSDHEAGFVSDETASLGRGYAPGEAEKAQEDHANRLARIKEAQSSLTIDGDARGVKDEATDPGNSGRQEKQNSQDGNMK